jgi:hypothetical protein
MEIGCSFIVIDLFLRRESVEVFYACIGLEGVNPKQVINMNLEKFFNGL